MNEETNNFIPENEPKPLNAEHHNHQLAVYEPISTKDWALNLLLLAIPLVNIIILIVWVLSDETHPSKRNFAKAYLMILSVAIVFAVLIFVWLFGSFMSVMMNS